MIEGLEHLPLLNTLDIAYNNIGEISGLEACPDLNELWLNMNKIEDPDKTLLALSQLKNLKTIYLTDNPVVKRMGGTYHE